MVPVISCAAVDGTPGQQAEPGQEELINAALAFGGPVCTWKTFESVTGIHIDHFIELDFTGFEKIINDLGGVEVCLPFAVDDPHSGLNLRRGATTSSGRRRWPSGAPARTSARAPTCSGSSATSSSWSRWCRASRTAAC